ncbi:hypothetical protein HCN44_006738 [Aphidius gifuensis]|uniref:Kinesin motor domain-containing protein n=1 Tax=Aphidius gifuensis TaxID=684658 RepID=A0A834Y0E8_APHGI|nr:hypothetical protein HCN44_006738 [Aphidius gifuensis]
MIYLRQYARINTSYTLSSSKLSSLIKYIDEFSIKINDNGKQHKFTFNKVFPSTATQLDIFEDVSTLIQSAVDGYNASIIAYGLTGSGKTYTMEGTHDNPGIITRSINLIFSQIEQLQRVDWRYKVEVSFIEIYNEKIYDLLDKSLKQCFDNADGRSIIKEDN